jgi:hypothetical protein
MVKILLTATAACLLVNAHGQVDFGVTSGYSLSTTKHTGTYQTPTYNFGLLGQIKITKKVFLRPQIEYSTEGFKFPSLATQKTTLPNTMQSTYINVPVLFLTKLSTKFFVFAGPQFGLRTNTNPTNNNGKQYITSSFKKYTVGVDVGAAYFFAKKFGAEARYYYGLSRVQNPFKLTDYTNGSQPPNYPPNGSARVFQAGIFYMLSR